MKEDMRKFRPDVAKVLRETTPEKVAERRRVALAKLREDGLIPRETPVPPMGEAAKMEPKAAAADAATGPAVVAEEEAKPAMKPAVAKVAPRPAAHSGSWKLVIGLALVAAAAPVAVVLAGKTKDARVSAELPAAMTSTTATPSALGAASVPSMAVSAATANATAIVSAAATPKLAPKRPPRAPQDDPHDAGAAPTVTASAPPPAPAVPPELLH